MIVSHDSLHMYNVNSVISIHINVKSIYVWLFENQCNMCNTNFTSFTSNSTITPRPCDPQNYIILVENYPEQPVCNYHHR